MVPTDIIWLRLYPRLALSERQFYGLIEGVLLTLVLKTHLLRGAGKVGILDWYIASVRAFLESPCLAPGEHWTHPEHPELGPFCVLRPGNPADARPGKETPAFVFVFPCVRTLKDTVFMVSYGLDQLHLQ